MQIRKYDNVYRQPVYYETNPLHMPVGQCTGIDVQSWSKDLRHSHVEIRNDLGNACDSVGCSSI